MTTKHGLGAISDRAAWRAEGMAFIARAHKMLLPVAHVLLSDLNGAQDEFARWALFPNRALRRSDDLKQLQAAIEATARERENLRKYSDSLLLVASATEWSNHHPDLSPLVEEICSFSDAVSEISAADPGTVLGRILPDLKAAQQRGLDVIKTVKFRYQRSRLSTDRALPLSITDERNKFCYDERIKGTVYKEIVAAVKRKTEWEPLSTNNSVKRAAESWIKSQNARGHMLPKIPARQAGTPKRKP
jgi:hypothetical protein